MSHRQLELRIRPRPVPAPAPRAAGAAARPRGGTLAILAVTGAAAILLAALLALASAAVAAEAGPSLSMETSGWQAIRKAFGETVPGKGANATLYDLVWKSPGYATLSKVVPVKQLNPAMLSNVAAYVFGEDRSGNLPKRADLIDNFLYLQRNLDRADELAARLQGAELSTEVAKRLAPFVRPGELPDSVTVHLLAMAPEIKYANGQLWLDAGMALAAGQEQLPDLLAAVLYREVGLTIQPEPRATPLGAPALRATFGRLLQEGIGAWLERYGDLSLDPTHATFSHRPESRLVPFVRAREVMEALQNNLKPLLDEKDAIESRSLLLDDLLRGGGGYPVLGYAMVAVIADTYGNDRLYQVSRDPEAFLRAYQDAARKRPADLVAYENDPVQHGMNNMPYFDSKDFSKLMKIMK